MFSSLSVAIFLGLTLGLVEWSGIVPTWISLRDGPESLLLHDFVERWSGIVFTLGLLNLD